MPFSFTSTHAMPQQIPINRITAKMVCGRVRAACRTIAARAQAEVQGSPPFRLTHHPERIPLSVNDGEPVDVAPLDAAGDLAAGWSKVLQFSSLGTAGAGEMWAADVAGRTGWVRLFANLSDATRLRQLALLDPPVNTLRLTEAPK